MVLIIRAGSSDLWVPSANCTASACESHNKYDAGSSSTAKQIGGAKLNIAYGDGSSTTGDVYTDVVTGELFNLLYA